MDSNGPVGSVHGPVDKHAFELDLQITRDRLGRGGDVPLQEKRLEICSVCQRGDEQKKRQTHLSSKLLNPTRIDPIRHIRIRVLETDRILIDTPAGQILSVLVSAAHRRGAPFGGVVDDLLDGVLELLAGDIPVAAAQEVVVFPAGELEAVVAEEGGLADHVRVLGVGGEVEAT
jgi:hypothetical protein